MPFPEWTPPKVSDEPKEPGWGPVGDLRRSMEVLKSAPPTLQEQRIAELEAALRALVAVEPRCSDQNGEPVCAYCYGWTADPSSSAVVHAPDCPWVIAKALLPEAP